MTEEQPSTFLNVDPKTAQITGTAPNTVKFELMGNLSDVYEKINGKTPSVVELQEWLKTEKPSEKP